MAERPTWLVARREITEATRSTSFRVTLIISAVAVAAIIVIANLGGGGESTQDVVLAGSSDRAAAVEATGAAAGIAVDVSVVADDASARAAVADDDADLAISADGAVLTTREPVDLEGDSQLATLINVLRPTLALESGLDAAGLTPAQQDTVRSSPLPDVTAVQPADTGEVDSGRVATATITNILLFLMLQSYGQWVLQGVAREKQSRVVEVLLATISPRQLLIGKVLGIGLVALMNAAVIIVTALVTARIMGVSVASGLSVETLGVAAAWFLLGYALYCNAYAAAGSLVSRVEDGQTVAFPIMLPLLFGYIVSFSVAGGASTLLWVLAFIPPTAVVAMPTLYAIGAASVWMMLASMALTVIAIVIVAALAIKIYERSVLHSGRKLSWRDALRRGDPSPNRAVTAAD